MKPEPPVTSTVLSLSRIASLAGLAAYRKQAE
jgi:hypothetical protein